MWGAQVYCLTTHNTQDSPPSKDSDGPEFLAAFRKSDSWASYLVPKSLLYVARAKGKASNDSRHWPVPAMLAPSVFLLHIGPNTCQAHSWLVLEVGTVMTPWDIHILIPRTRGSVAFLGRRSFTDGLKLEIWGWGDDAGSPWWWPFSRSVMSYSLQPHGL